MKRAGRIALAQQLHAGLNKLKEELAMPGLVTAAHQEVLVQQLIDSIRRIRFVTILRERSVDAVCADPNSDAFDPIKGASYLFRQGCLNEACWLSFLAIHFGKNKKSKWSLIKSVYGGLGDQVWSWEVVTNRFDAFDKWLSANYSRFVGAYGNHRKYESVRPDAERSPAKIFGSYIDWVGCGHDHSARFQVACQTANNDPIESFDILYRSLGTVVSFGRTTRFDYLTMIGKLGLANIVPGKTYLDGATGPKKAAKLLFGENANNRFSIQDLDKKLAMLHAALPLGVMGMQVLEDALCNWQKAPDRYALFKG
ncbi:MAG: hypothetical protein ABUS47_00235 [Steroidobacter sp.]